MNKFEIQGKFLGANAEKVISDKFRTRDFYVDVTDNDKYPSPIKFQAVNDACDYLDFSKGDIVNVSFSLRGSLWQSPNGKKVITNLNATRVTPASASAKVQSIPAEEAFPEDPDDLPF